jgi:hypothetical protein
MARPTGTKRADVGSPSVTIGSCIYSYLATKALELKPSTFENPKTKILCRRDRRWRPSGWQQAPQGVFLFQTTNAALVVLIRITGGYVHFHCMVAMCVPIAAMYLFNVLIKLPFKLLK